jgi:DNA-binding beta-propeller fold protein YncE
MNMNSQNITLCKANKVTKPLAAVLALLLGACAAAPQKPAPSAAEEEKLAWPKPPSEPVIEFVREFDSELVFDQKKESAWKDALLGEEESGVYRLLTPYSVAVHPDGRVMVADTKLRGLAVWDFNKKTFAMYGESGDGMLTRPIGVGSDRFGRIYVSDGLGNKVVVFDSNGNYLRTLGGEEEFGRPVGIAVDNERERVFVVDMLKHHVAVFDFDGERTGTVGERGEDLLQFNFPLNLDIDGEGRLYLLDSMNFRVQVIEPDLETTRSIGEQGGGAGQFTRPKGVAVDPDGNVYVVDSAFNNVQVFNNTGELLMFFGEAGSSRGQFVLPADLAIDEQGLIYVADQSNGRIQVFRYLGPPELPAEDAASPDQP